MATSAIGAPPLASSSPIAALSFDPMRLLPRLGAIVAALAVLDVLGLVSTYYFGHSRLLGLIPLFRLDLEKNVPTLFATLLLLGCAAVTSAKAAATRDRRESFHWWGLAVLFGFMAWDEFFSWHETIAGPIRRSLGTSGLLHFAWVIPYGIAVLALAVWYWPFLLRLDRSLLRRLVVAAAVYLAGALGMEMVGGAYWNGVESQRDFVYGLLTTVEETLEMIGLVLALRAFVLGFGLQALGFTAQFRPRPARGRTAKSARV